MLFTISPKRSTEVNVGASLLSSTSLKYGRQGADSVASACDTLTQLRNVALTAARDNRARELCEASLAYFLALSHIEKLVRLPPRGSRDALQVSWEDAFAPPSKNFRHSTVPKTSSHNLELDRYAMVFNIAAAECGLALLAERSAVSTTPSNETLRAVAAHFQRSAGALKYISGLPTAPVDNDVTDDLTREALVALEHAMLANAQAMSYKMATNNESMSHSTCALVAAGARDLCEVVAKHCSAAALRDSPIYRLVGLPARVFCECWNAESHCRVELDLGHNMKERLARIRDARASIDRAEHAVKLIDDDHPLKAELQADISRRQDSINRRSMTVENENRRIYHVYEQQSIPNVSGRVLVKSLPLESLFSGEVDPRILLFDNLEDSQVSELSTQYEKLTLQLVGTELQKLETSSVSLRKEIARAEDALSDVKFDDRSGKEHVVQPSSSEENVSEEGMSDAEAVETVRNVKVLGGFPHLAELRDRVKLLSRIAEEELNEIATMLEKEEEEGSAVHADLFSGYRQRPTSESLHGKTYKLRLDHMRDSISRAKNADAFVNKAVQENSAAISAVESVDGKMLDSIQLEENFPNTGRFLATNQEHDAVSLRGLVAAANELLQSKDKIASDLKSLQADDSAQTKFGGDPSLNSLDSSMSMNLDDKYGSLKACAATFGERAASCEELLRASTAKLEGTNRCMQAHAQKLTGIYRHLAAAKKYFELQKYLKEGINFYSKETEAIKKLKSDVTEFVDSRSKELADPKQRSQSAFHRR